MNDPYYHADGTECKEGNSSELPNDFKVCCEDFKYHLSSCVFDLRYEYWRKSRKWVIAICSDVGGGGYEINYCPHCGEILEK